MCWRRRDDKVLAMSVPLTSLDLRILVGVNSQLAGRLCVESP
jgi:hypothetical protein